MTEQELSFYYEKYYTSMVYYANSIVKNIEEAKDIAQDSFLAGYKQHDLKCSGTQFKAFLYTSIRCKCIDYLRKVKSRRKQHEEVSYLFDIISLDSVRIIDSEVIKFVLDEIENLPDRAREVVQLIVIGKDTTFISEKMQISRQTVRNLKTAAIDKLKILARKKLRKYD